MQFKIPQDVGIEDKIVGPLTLRQLIIIAVGSGISYVLFGVLSKIYEINFLEYIIIGLPMFLSAAFALIKINNVTLVRFILLFMEFAIKPKKRVWDHRGILNITAPELNDVPAESTDTSSADALLLKSRRRANLEELTRALDSNGFEHVGAVQHDDLDKTHDDDLISEAYFGHKKDESPTKNMYWRTKESHKKMLDVFAKMPVTKIKKGSVEAMMARQEIDKVKQEVARQNPQIVSSNTKHTVSDSNPPLRKRPRRKPAQPARTKDGEIQAHHTPPSNKPANKATNLSEGEFDFRELKKGEIEINLDD